MPSAVAVSPAPPHARDILGRVVSPDVQVRPLRQLEFREALRFWIKLGFISFGGPAGQIAIMHRELVERRRWISEERFLHALNYCMLLPGPEAQQLATYIGWLLHRTVGGIVAGACFILPSIFVLLGLSYIYAAYGNVPLVVAVLSGFKPVVIAIVIEAVVRIGRRALKRSAHFAFAALAFIGIYVLYVPFPLIVILAGLGGFAGARLWPQSFLATPSVPRVAGRTPAAVTDEGTLPVVVDDEVAPLPHLLLSRGRALRILAAGAVLWVLPFAALGAWRGWGSLHVREYEFFTQAALVTFGGAYSVLAYVTQTVAGEYGWITHAQAVDGLALAETTPGPLIMVLQFVGYLAAWQRPEGLDSATSALIGGTVTTYVTFLPSFLFILIGGPYIERLRGNRDLAGALSGVTAAVVGVVLNLAVVFGTAVVWPDGLASAPDWFAIALCIGAWIALDRFKIDVVWVVLAGGAIGAARLL